MLSNLKINTAVVICLAFIFRLILVNTTLVSSFNLQSNRPPAHTHKGSVAQETQHTEVGPRSDEKNYTSVEICEEGSDIEEDVTKASPPVILSFLYAIFNANITPGPDNSFDSIKCNLYPRKYLALSILRI